MKIAGFDTHDRVLVIAEIGNNHEGDFEVARELVRMAAESGVDAVKFQTFRADRFVSSSDEARFARMQRFELTPEQFGTLAEDARANGLLFLSTPLDLPSADVLEPLVDAFKVASGDNTFWPLLERIARTKKPVIVSVGLSELEQIEETVRFLGDHESGELALLHCVSSYPVEPGEANVRAVVALADAFDCTVGYSDHTVGLEAALLSVALGARIVEKHFTLDNAYSDFRDHQLSLDPADMRKLVDGVRRAEVMLGAGGTTVQPSERENAPAMRRSIVAAANLAAGHVIGASDLMWIRPGGGLEPGREDELVGRTLVRDVRFGEQFALTDVG